MTIWHIVLKSLRHMPLATVLTSVAVAWRLVGVFRVG